MAYAFNDDKTKVDINGLIAYKDITVPAAVNANTGTTKFASVTIPDGYQLIGVAVINKPAAGTYHAQAIYIGSTSTPIGVSIYNASSENVTSGTVIARVYMIKTTFLTVLTD